MKRQPKPSVNKSAKLAGPDWAVDRFCHEVRSSIAEEETTSGESTRKDWHSLTCPVLTWWLRDCFLYMVTLLEPEKLSLIKQYSGGLVYGVRVAKAKGCQGPPTSKCTEVVAPHDIAVGIMCAKLWCW
jgi:hypothetical protein